MACWLWGELVYGVTPPGVGLIARNTCFVPIFGTFRQLGENKKKW